MPILLQSVFKLQKIAIKNPKWTQDCTWVALKPSFKPTLHKDAVAGYRRIGRCDCIVVINCRKIPLFLKKKISTEFWCNFFSRRDRSQSLLKIFVSKKVLVLWKKIQSAATGLSRSTLRCCPTVVAIDLLLWSLNFKMEAILPDEKNLSNVESQRLSFYWVLSYDTFSVPRWRLHE